MKWLLITAIMFSVMTAKAELPSESEVKLARDLVARAGGGSKWWYHVDGESETYQGRFTSTGKPCRMTFQWSLVKRGFDEQGNDDWRAEGLNVRSYTDAEGDGHSYSYWTSDFHPMPILGGPKLEQSGDYSYIEKEIRVLFSSSNKALGYELRNENGILDACEFF